MLILKEPTCIPEFKRYVFIIIVACISLSRCGSFITVTEDEAVQLEFPYPCDSNKVTVQIANRLPFYSSTDTANLHLPNYQFHRFSVTDGNCSVQVQINPVKRSDKATYICQAYRDGAIQSELTRIRLNVNYPPGNLYCTFSVNDDADHAIGDWVPLYCEARVGSLAGGIYCYQDSKRLPPLSTLVQIGDNLKQTIWVSKEHPVFCCSAILDRPKDRCDCTGFVWDPMGNISHTKNMLDPCPATTPGPIATLFQYPEREVEDIYQLPQIIESLNLTDTNKYQSTAESTAVLWVDAIAIGILVTIMVIIIIRLYVVEKTSKQFKKCQSTIIPYHRMKNENKTSITNSQEEGKFLHYRSINKHSKKGLSRGKNSSMMVSSL